MPQTVLLVQLSARGRSTDKHALTEELARQVLQVNDDLDSHAKIACVIVSVNEWTAADGLVTHTLKIKRSALEKRYDALADSAFSSGASINKPLIIWESVSDSTTSPLKQQER
jgi:long-chain acyl-CoA synthetase